MSIHVCKCERNGHTEYHLRYPGMSECEAQGLADRINAGALTQPAKPAASPPEIDYDELIKAAYSRDTRWAQGTAGCVAFARGAEWYRSTLETQQHLTPESVNPSGVSSPTMVEALSAWASDLERGIQVSIPASSLRKIAESLVASQQPGMERITDEENERFSQDVSSFSGSDPEATRYALDQLMRRRAALKKYQSTVQRPVAWRAKDANDKWMYGDLPAPDLPGSQLLSLSLPSTPLATDDADETDVPYRMF